MTSRWHVSLHHDVIFVPLNMTFYLIKQMCFVLVGLHFESLWRVLMIVLMTCVWSEMNECENLSHDEKQTHLWQPVVSFSSYPFIPSSEIWSMKLNFHFYWFIWGFLFQVYVCCVLTRLYRIIVQTEMKRCLYLLAVMFQTSLTSFPFDESILKTSWMAQTGFQRHEREWMMTEF